jgi:hypothetical protein
MRHRPARICDQGQNNEADRGTAWHPSPQPPRSLGRGPSSSMCEGGTRVRPSRAVADLCGGADTSMTFRAMLFTIKAARAHAERLIESADHQRGDMPARAPSRRRGRAHKTTSPCCGKPASTATPPLRPNSGGTRWDRSIRPRHARRGPRGGPRRHDDLTLPPFTCRILKGACPVPPLAAPASAHERRLVAIMR